MKERVDYQIDWYNKRSKTNKLLHNWAKVIVILLAAVIPFLVGFIYSCTLWIKNVVGLLGVIIAVVTGISALFKFHEKWTEYRTTAETLKKEKYLYQTKTGFYQDVDKPFELFVERVESLISTENTAWKNYVTKHH